LLSGPPALDGFRIGRRFCFEGGDTPLEVVEPGPEVVERRADPPDKTITLGDERVEGLGKEGP
jgi:hypothetical protein